MKNKRLTHEEHLQFAAQFHTLRNGLRNFRASVGSSFPKAHRINEELRNIFRRMMTLQSSLDDEYHAVTSDEQFSTKGHVYYGDGRKPR